MLHVGNAERKGHETCGNILEENYFFCRSCETNWTHNTDTADVAWWRSQKASIKMRGGWRGWKGDHMGSLQHTLNPPQSDRRMALTQWL